MVVKNNVKEKIINTLSKGMPKNFNNWIFLPDQDIIQRFNGVLRGLI